MNYGLAKRLRNAGFPQGGNGSWIGPANTLVWRSRDRIYVPTLEELIEACGGKSLKLVADAEGAWSAVSYVQAKSAEGSSADEAIGRLWLVLYGYPRPVA